MEARKKIGITGSNGRIGTILRKTFLDSGEYDVKFFVYEAPNVHNANQTRSEAIPSSIDSIFVDLSKEDQVVGIFEGLDVVIHLAALVDVTPYGENWQSMWKNNFEATYFVFRECIRAKVSLIR